jgi:hypothetical protein
VEAARYQGRRLAQFTARLATHVESAEDGERFTHSQADAVS